jgi:hypothetical protein
MIHYGITGSVTVPVAGVGLPQTVDTALGKVAAARHPLDEEALPDPTASNGDPVQASTSTVKTYNVDSDFRDRRKGAMATASGIDWLVQAQIFAALIGALVRD